MDSYKEESTRSSPETFSSIQRSLLSRIAIISKQSVLIKDASLKGSTISQIYLEDCIKLSPTLCNPRVQDKNWRNLNDPQFEILRWSTSPYLGVQTYQKDEKICCVFRDYLRSPIDGNAKNNNRYIFFLSQSPWSQEDVIYTAIKDLPIEDKYSGDVGNITDVAWGPYYKNTGKQILFIVCGKLVLYFIVYETPSSQIKMECKYICSFKPYDDNILSMEIKYSPDSEQITFLTSYSKGEILKWNLKFNKSNLDLLEKDSVQYIYPKDSRCVSLMKLGKNNILIAAKGGIIVIIDIESNLNTLYVAHEGMITSIDWINMDENIFVTVGTDAYFRIWKVIPLNNNNNNLDINLLYQCENTNGSIWGLSISPNKSFYYLLSKKEGQYKMYHQKIDSGLISFHRLSYFDFGQIIENLLHEEAPSYWDILILLSSTSLTTINNTIDYLKLHKTRDLNLKRVLYILLRYKKSCDNKNEELQQEIEILRNEIMEECIITIVNNFLELKNYKPNDEEITSLYHLHHYLMSNGSEKARSIAHNLDLKLKSFNKSPKAQVCTYCQSNVSYGDLQCPLSHELDWCPSTNLLLVNLNNKTCYNCDLLYKDLQQSEGFEWIPKYPQVCFTCGEILRPVR